MTLDHPLSALRPGATVIGYTEAGRPFGVIVGGGQRELAQYQGRARRLARAQTELLVTLGPTATVYDALSALRPAR